MRLDHLLSMERRTRDCPESKVRSTNLTVCAGRILTDSSHEEGFVFRGRDGNGTRCLILKASGHRDGGSRFCVKGNLQGGRGNSTEEMATEYGGVAQLGEHLPCKQGVDSSILFISTSSCTAGKTRWQRVQTKSEYLAERGTAGDCKR